MEIDGHQSTFANSVFSTYQPQGSVNVGGGNNSNVGLPFLSTPGVSLQKQDTESSVPWSDKASSDPYDLIKCAQSNMKSRRATDNADCDGEADLHGLVSNILDEADSQDSYYSDGSLPSCNPLWSPKTLREELLPYFQSEAKMQHNSAFPPNYVSREAFCKAQGQSMEKDVGQFFHQPNGLAINQQWLFDLPNGDTRSYTIRPQKLPPGLPVPNLENTSSSQMQQRKCDNTSADKDKGICQPMNTFSDLSDVFRLQNEMNSLSFHPYYDDHHTQSSTRSVCNDQYVPQEINQLVSSFQSFMASEHNSLCPGDPSNIQRQIVGMNHDDSMVGQWKNTSPTMSTQSIPAMQTTKQLVGERGPVQMERNGGVMNQTFKHDNFQDIPGFHLQNTEYFQQHLSASLSLPNQYQSKMSLHKENASLPFNMSMNQYSKHHIHQGQIQAKIKTQMQKEKKRTHMSGLLGEGFSSRPITNTNMRGRDKKHASSQNPYFDQSERDNCRLSTEITKQLMPVMYAVNDPRRHAGITINSPHVSSRSTLPYRGGVPGLDVSNLMSANDSAAFSCNGSDMVTCRGESTYHGMTSDMTASMAMNQEGSLLMQLYFHLEECHEQWRCLEKERKRAEAILCKTFTGKWTASVTNTNLPKTPPNASRVDQLIVNQMREQARVASLLDRMECLNNTNIHAALSRHHKAICVTQSRRNEEIANMSKRQQQRDHFTEDRDTPLLIIALRDLAAATKKLSSELWYCFQITVLKPVETQDYQANTEATQRCSSPFEGYYFSLSFSRQQAWVKNN